MGIPESILKKLIVPDSFHKEVDHFSVKLNNSFAPATISSFKVLINGTPIDGQHVFLSSSQMDNLAGSAIGPDKPVTLPVREEITLVVKIRITNETVKIFATTREVGDIEFSITGATESNIFKPLRPGFFNFLRSPRRAVLVVNTEKPLGQASPFIFGHFIEHLERCIYDGIWTKDGSKLREDSLALIKELRPSIIRYPGGNFASGYHWEDGIGPKHKRPSRHDAAWQAEDSNQVGTDEFLTFCELIQTEPYLVVNDGSGTPEEAAQWVEYCNGDISTSQGKRRAENGHPDSYHVKHWGIGNEVWGPWQIGTTSAENYTRRFNNFASTMRKVDPEIKIIAVGHNPITDDPNDPAAVWNRVVLENSSQDIDYLSWHIYQPEKESWKTDYDPIELFKSVSSAHLDLEEILHRVEKQIQEYSKKPILQAVDEWNLWLPPVENDVSMHAVTYTMRDALYATSALATFARHNHTIGMANLAQMVNVLPLIQTNESTAIRTTMFFPFLLFSMLPGEILENTFTCETFSSSQLDTNVKARSAVPYLDSITGIDRNKNELGIILINRYPLDKLKVKIAFPGIKNLEPIDSSSIHASYPDASNTFEHPNRVRYTKYKLPSGEGSEWQITMKPCSVVMLRFRYS